MVYDDGLTRDREGKRTDKTGKRDLAFSQWHRKFLSRRCYAADIDFYEYRWLTNNQLEPKAFLEVKRSHVRQWKYIATSNTIAIFTLAKRAGVRFLMVLYEPTEEIEDEKDPPPFKFWVWEPESVEEIRSYEEERFEEFFKSMSNRQFIELIENL